MKRKFSTIIISIAIFLLMFSCKNVMSQKTAEITESELSSGVNYIDSLMCLTMDVILTISDVPELEKAMDILDDNEKHLMQSVIEFIKNNGQISIDELEYILGFNIPRMMLSGEVDNFPRLFWYGTWLPPANLNLLNGDVWVYYSPFHGTLYSAPRSVGFVFFIGVYWLTDPFHGGYYMHGWVFGLNLDTSSSQGQQTITSKTVVGISTSS